MGTKKGTGISQPQNRRLIYIINGLTLVITSAVFLAGKFPSVNNWGISHLAFYSPAMQILIPFLLLLLLLPPVRYILAKRVDGIVTYFGKRTIHVRRISALVFLIAMGFLFWTFSTATHFLGDGYGLLTYLRDFGKKGYYLWPSNHEPLATYVVFQLSRLYREQGLLDPELLAFRAVALFSGILCMIVQWRLTGFLSENRSERVLMFLFLLATGTSQMFFGYVENYALSYAFIFLFMLVSFAYLRQSISIAVPLLVFPVMVASYFATIIFLPALVLLMWISIRRKEPKTVLLSSVGSILTALGLMQLLGYTPDVVARVLEETQNPMIIPMLKITTAYQAYTFFSFAHLKELLNLFFLIQPTALVLLIAGGWLMSRQTEERDEKLYLLLMIAGGIFFVCIANSWIGMNRDWDALSVFFSGISVAALYGWFKEKKESSLRWELLVTITLIALVQTGLWIGINADEAKAIARIDSLKDDPCWSERGIGNFNEARGNLYWVRRQYVEATACYERGLAFDPNNPRFLLQLGKTYFATGQKNKSLEIYIKIDSLDCGNAEAYNNLASLYIQQSQFEKASICCDKAERVDSTYALTQVHKGVILYLREQSPAKALPYFLKAVNLDRQLKPAYNYAGICYREMGDTDRAKKYIDWCNTLPPD